MKGRTRNSSNSSDGSTTSILSRTSPSAPKERPQWDGSFFDPSTSNATLTPAKKSYFSATPRLCSKNRAIPPFRRPLHELAKSTPRVETPGDKIGPGSSNNRSARARQGNTPRQINGNGYSPRFGTSPNTARETEQKGSSSDGAATAGCDDAATGSAEGMATAAASTGMPRKVQNYLRVRSEATAALARSWNSIPTMKRIRGELLDIVAKIDERFPDLCKQETSVQSSEPAPENMEEKVCNLEQLDVAPSTPVKETKGCGKGKATPPPIPRALGKGDGKGKSTKPARQKQFGCHLDWSIVPDTKVEGTIFEYLNDVDCQEEDLHRLFQKKTSRALSVKAKEEVLTLLSVKRAQSVLILLRKWPLDEKVLMALSELDVNADLSEDYCEGLMGIMPTAEDLRLLSDYTGSVEVLRDAERALMPLVRLVAPSAVRRLQVLMFSSRMKETAALIESNLDDVDKALDAVRESEAFKQVLAKVRRLGNAIIFGSFAAASDQAQGFSISALSKLERCKSTIDWRVSLLHVLVREMPVNLDSELFVQLDTIPGVAKMSLRDLARDISSFRDEANHIESCIQELFAISNDTAVPTAETPQLEILSDSSNQDIGVEQPILSLRESKLGRSPAQGNSNIVDQECTTVLPNYNVDSDSNSDNLELQPCIDSIDSHDEMQPNHQLDLDASINSGNAESGLSLPGDSIGSGGEVQTNEVSLAEQRLRAFSAEAAQNASRLEAKMTETSTKILRVLEFFAESTSFGPEEADVKVQEFFVSVSNFLDAYNKCAKQLARPEFKDLCGARA